MSSQTEEWEDMTETQRTEIKNRLHAVLADVDRTEYRARLARASRSGLTARLERR